MFNTFQIVLKTVLLQRRHKILPTSSRQKKRKKKPENCITYTAQKSGIIAHYCSLCYKKSMNETHIGIYTLQIETTYRTKYLAE